MITKQNYLAKKEKLLQDFRQMRGGVAPRLGKSTSNLFRYRQRKAGNRLDLQDFRHVISIDKENLTAEVEGLTTYERFMDETVDLGVIPAVVPELKSITVGGAISGVGLETSSFRYGFVHETVLELDILTADGRIVTCTPENKYRDLFYGFPNTYGTLGYVLRAKVKLQPVKPYVKIVREQFDTIPRFVDRYQKVTLEHRDNPEVGFIEGFSFSPTEHYLAIVYFKDRAPYLSDYTFMEIYYKSMRRLPEDYLTTFDYIWRLDPDWFWCSRRFGMENRVLRFLLGKFMLKSSVYWKVMNLSKRVGLLDFLNWLQGKKTELVIQDVEIPIDKAAEYLDWHHREVGVAPIILVTTTVQEKERPFTFFPLDPDKLNVNIGFYDSRETVHEPGHYTRKVECKAHTLGGHKLLYSDCFYSEKEFWEIYNKPAYDALKAKYDPEGTFLNLYQKCVQRR